MPKGIHNGHKVNSGSFKKGFKRTFYSPGMLGKKRSSKFRKMMSDRMRKNNPMKDDVQRKRQRERMLGKSGVASLHWKGGIAKSRPVTTDKYKNWRLSVFQRDGFICQICFEVGGKLHAHHIMTWAKHPSLRYVVSNGITLCVKDHRKLHAKFGYK